jgi:hypothetical protein
MRHIIALEPSGVSLPTSIHDHCVSNAVQYRDVEVQPRFLVPNEACLEFVKRSFLQVLESDADRSLTGSRRIR